MWLAGNCVLTTLRTVSRPLRSYSTVAIDKFLENLTSSTNGLPLENINEALQVHPELKNYPPALWQQTYDTILQQGFKSSSFLRIISQHPAILNYSSDRLTASIESWRASQFGEKNIQLLIEKYPQLLEFSNEVALSVRVQELYLYAGTRKHVWRMFMCSPNLLLDKKETIDAKIEYLKTVMRVDVGEVIRSEVFSHSLDKIRCRHQFMERLGLYKVRNPKSDPDEPSSNPKLYQIMDTSDKRFAIKVAFVTLEEYEAFEELFKREPELVLDNFEYGREHDQDHDLDDGCETDSDAEGTEASSYRKQNKNRSKVNKISQ